MTAAIPGLGIQTIRCSLVELSCASVGRSTRRHQRGPCCSVLAYTDTDINLHQGHQYSPSPLTTSERVWPLSAPTPHPAHQTRAVPVPSCPRVYTHCMHLSPISVRIIPPTHSITLIGIPIPDNAARVPDPPQDIPVLARIDCYAAPFGNIELHSAIVRHLGVHCAHEGFVR